MRRWSRVVAIAIMVALSAGAIASAPADDPGPLHATMLASVGTLPEPVHQADHASVAAYQAAIEHPSVLASVPCLCGCIQSLGHTSNLDCYIESSSRGMTIYSTHGLNCLICQRITEDALAGAARGMSPAQLRMLIEEKYGG
ncbi:MAG TPA: PCYCGC motif-containing (lipo)protein [Thermomicrobiales bacterium]|nr:PCYCGC motif-containing (lipo)protein [Thermomicrobiales bacterium]